MKEHLPLGRHVFTALQFRNRIQNLPFVDSVRTQKVVVSHPKGNVVVGTFVVVVAAGNPVGGLESSVEAFNAFLIRTPFFGDSVIVSKADDLSDVETELFAVLTKELLSSQRIGTVAVCYEAEILRKILEVTEGSAHCHNAGTNIPMLRDHVSEDGSRDSVHDDPKVSFDTADFEVGFVSGHLGRGMVIVVVCEGLDDHGSGSGIVGDLLVRDINAVEILHGLSCFAKGELQVHMESQAKRHDVGVVFGEAQG